jgi:hypothetical protein
MTFAARVQALRDRYPYQFARTFQYGLSIETGWIAIIESACAQIDLALEEGGARKQNFSFLQVKEKLGSLRMAWDRTWRVPEAPRSLADDEPEFIFPESVPEDPEADQFETVEAYLASPRAAEWDRLHMIPNPALANVRLEPRRYFDRLMTINFEDGVPDAEQDYITRSIAMLVMVPEAASQCIREIIEAAEKAASKTCQFCGESGTRKQLDGDGWLVVGCEKHSTRDAVVALRKQDESQGDRDDRN